MEPVCNFIKEIKQDCSIIYDHKDISDESRSQRITSVCLRILGAFTVGCAVGCFITGVAALISAPLFALVSMAQVVALAILAHDLIKTGTNLKKPLDINFNSFSSEETILDKAWRVGSGVWNCTKAVYGEVTTGVPYAIQGTILFAPIYKNLHTVEVDPGV